MVSFADLHRPRTAAPCRDPAQFALFHRAWKVPLPQVYVITDTAEELTPELLGAVVAEAEAADLIKFFVAARDTGDVSCPYLQPADSLSSAL